MSIRTIPAVRLPAGESIPVMGLGTWHLGENPARRASELAALRLGIDVGLTLIDTAEMYGNGATEVLVGEAIAGRRDEVFLVSKVLPSHATYADTIEACRQSLRRLGTERLDLYLLHWRGRNRLRETVDAFEKLMHSGKILRWGVSNFDADDMSELARVPRGGRCATNQVLYHVRERGIEWELLPKMRARAMPLMAYSPLAQGALPRDAKLAAISKRLGCTAAQLAIAWLARQRDVIVIPKASDVAHVRANRAAAGVTLDTAALAEIDRAFPPPAGKRPLAIL
jgi:diketogulonate reductase-like aldo/keto reductase